MHLPNPATTKELLRWLAAHEGVLVEAYYAARPGLRCTHSLIGAEWQVYDEGIDGEPRKVSFAEFQETYAGARWQITEVNGEPAPVYPEPMVVPIQPGEVISIYTLQLAMAGDTRKGDENAQHYDEISETLRDWQYAADVALRDWRYINPPVVVQANDTPPIAEGEIFPDTDVTFHPDGSSFTHPDQAQARAQRAAEPVILWCKRCEAVSWTTHAPCCDDHGYACPECGSDTDSVRVYTVGEAQQIVAQGSSRLVTRFAPVLAQIASIAAASAAAWGDDERGQRGGELDAERALRRVQRLGQSPVTDYQVRAEKAPPASAPEYVVAFLADGVVTDWQYLSAAEAQSAVASWTNDAVEQRSGPWDEALVYSATSADGNYDAWAFPLDYVRQEAAYIAVAGGVGTPEVCPAPASFDMTTVLALRPG